MTDLTRLISRIDDLTRRLADLEAEHAALVADHRLLKLRVEEMESGESSAQVEVREIPPYSKDDYECFHKWYETHGRGHGPAAKG